MTELRQAYHQNNQDINDICPKVYIACLASYNGGDLHGDWIIVPETVEELQEAINAILKTSEHPNAEGWAIHDHENFEPFEIGEYESLDGIVTKANAINSLDPDEIDPFLCWESDYCDIREMDAEEILEKFREEYAGAYDSEWDYAYELMNDCYEVPEYLSNYIDYQSFWTDLTYDGYYSVHKNGQAFIFRPT